MVAERRDRRSRARQAPPTGSSLDALVWTQHQRWRRFGMVERALKLFLVPKTDQAQERSDRPGRSAEISLVAQRRQDLAQFVAVGNGARVGSPAPRTALDHHARLGDRVPIPVGALAPAGQHGDIAAPFDVGEGAGPGASTPPAAGRQQEIAPPEPGRQTQSVENDRRTKKCPQETSRAGSSRRLRRRGGVTDSLRHRPTPTAAISHATRAGPRPCTDVPSTRSPGASGNHPIPGFELAGDLDDQVVPVCLDRIRLGDVRPFDHSGGRRVGVSFDDRQIGAVFDIDVVSPDP